jgi:hypothetical protein
MMRTSYRRRFGAALVFAVLAGAAATAASASPIWERAGAFQACLETRFKEWVDSRAELVANLDPAASDIDDAAVAQWTVAALEACRAQAGGGDQESEARFAKHMASWRDHINTVVQGIRQRGGGPD